jgi:RNA polymerase sigma factor (sigma-70 family)
VASDDKKNLAQFLAHRGRLIDYANAIVGSRVQAEDLVQEAFLRYAPSLHEPARAQPVAYLYRIVRNLALDWLRRRATEQRHQDAAQIAWLTPPEAATPEQDLLRREELRRVAAALAELPEAARLALEMHRIGGYRLQEIAARLGISVTSAHRLVRDAAVRVALRLGPRQGDDA